MRSGVARYRSDHELYESDSCEALRSAADRAEVTFRAFARGAYPGQVTPDHVLRQVQTVGYWNAPYQQSWGLDWHRNEGIEITFVSHGNVAFQVEGHREQLLNVGDLTITRPWQRHRVGNPQIAACALHWLILDVGVRRPNQPWLWPSWLCLAERDIRDLTTLLSNNEEPVWRGDREIRDCFLRLADVIDHHDPVTAESRVRLLIGELLMALTDLLRRAEPDLHPSLTSTERTVRLFLAALESRLDEPWTLDGMAHACGLGRSRFTHYCQQTTNATPVNYLNELRVLQAKQLLRDDTARSVTDIAISCGFGTSQYFATVFRKHAGETPSDYRARAPKPAGQRPAR